MNFAVLMLCSIQGHDRPEAEPVDFDQRGERRRQDGDDEAGDGVPGQHRGRSTKKDSKRNVESQVLEVSPGKEETRERKDSKRNVESQMLEVREPGRGGSKGTQC